jgi:di/tripeptidase
MAEDATVENLSESTPWRTSPDAPLIRLVQKALPGYKTTLSSGGLEPAGFVPRNPELQMVALGATIAEAHSFNEALHIGSAHALVKDVSTLLAALGDSALLREP